MAQIKSLTNTQIGKAIKNGINDGNADTTLAKFLELDVDSAFTWSVTPEGEHYWRSLNK